MAEAQARIHPQQPQRHLRHHAGQGGQNGNGKNIFQFLKNIFSEKKLRNQYFKTISSRPGYLVTPASWSVRPNWRITPPRPTPKRTLCRHPRSPWGPTAMATRRDSVRREWVSATLPSPPIERRVWHPCPLVYVSTNLAGYFFLSTFCASTFFIGGITFTTLNLCVRILAHCLLPIKAPNPRKKVLLDQRETNLLEVQSTQFRFTFRVSPFSIRLLSEWLVKCELRALLLYTINGLSLK